MEGRGLVIEVRPRSQITGGSDMLSLVEGESINCGSLKFQCQPEDFTLSVFEIDRLLLTTRSC